MTPSINHSNVIKCARTGNRNHPTEKPLKLLTTIILNTEGCETFYDPFAGSGSTLLACEQCGKSCFAMEIDPRFCDVIIKRWEGLTGEKAVKVPTGKQEGAQEKEVTEASHV